MALALVYAFNPVLYLSAADDLRPFAFLSPLLLIALLAIHFRRPLRERLIGFNMLFLARQEALILALFLIALLYLEARREETTVTGACRRLRPFLLSWTIWCIVIFSYFAWTGYSNGLIAELGKSRLPLAVIALGALLVLLGTTAKTWVTPALLGFGALACLVTLQSIQYHGWGAPLSYYLYYPQALLLSVVLIGATLQWASDRPSIARTLQRGAVVVAAGLLPAWFASPLAPFPLWQQYRGSRESAAFVYRAARVLPRHAAILTDFPALHAFHRFDRAYAYEQLPLSVASVAERGFPGNRHILEDLLRQQIDYAVIGNHTSPLLSDLAATAGVGLEVLGRGERFSSYRIAR